MLKPISLLFSVLSLVHVSNGQAGPGLFWSQQISGASGGNAQAFSGNGLFLTPDGSEVVAIVNDGKVASFRASDGQPLWSHNPPDDNGSATFNVETNSGITFSTANSGSSFMVYSVTYKDAGSAGNDYTVVIKRDMEGELLSVSPSLQGVQSGSPVVSDDGEFIFLTHNSPDRTTGYFSIVDDFGIVVTRSNTGGAFAPPGIYHSPEEGFYDSIPGIADGNSNTNDLVMWSLTPEAVNAPVPSGRIFAFQFAPDFDIDFDDVDSLNFFFLGSNRAFQTITPPVITNMGRSVYWSTSRSEMFGFIGSEGVSRARFNRNPNLRLQFESNSQWNGQPIFSAPVVSTDENGGGVVFGGSASNEFFRFTHSFNTDGELIVSTPNTAQTTSFIVTSPVIDPLGRAVYYVESDGTLHQADYTTIEDIWTKSIADGVQGEMALNQDGSVLYVVSVEGEIAAIGAPADASVPTLPPVTSAPSDQPSGQPTDRPSLQPSGQPSGRPTDEPSGQPTDRPSLQPSVQPSGRPTDEPSVQPSGKPNDQPFLEPSGKPSGQPSGQPSVAKSDSPTLPDSSPSAPNLSPTPEPSQATSTSPTQEPTKSQTQNQAPSQSQSNTRTVEPSSTSNAAGLSYSRFYAIAGAAAALLPISLY